jgi:hypothetical protein
MKQYELVVSYDPEHDMYFCRLNTIVYLFAQYAPDVIGLIIAADVRSVLVKDSIPSESWETLMDVLRETYPEREETIDFDAPGVLVYLREKEARHNLWAEVEL